MVNKVNKRLREEIGKLLIPGRMIIRVIICWTSDIQAKNLLLWGIFKKLWQLTYLNTTETHFIFCLVITGGTRVKYLDAYCIRWLRPTHFLTNWFQFELL